MWTIETYKEVYARYEASGLLVKDFCANERITRSRFFYWQKKLRKQGRMLPARHTSSASKTQFIPILVDDNASERMVPSKPNKEEVASQSRQSNAKFFMEIAYANGTIIRLSGEKDMELIKTLILLSGSVSCSV